MSDVDAPYGFELTVHDKGSWGASLLYNAELVIRVLELAGGESITEIGALDGDLTQLLAQWAERAGAQIRAVDPTPHPGLEALAEAHPAVELVRQTSLDALGRIPLSDTIIIDGDHNYYTVSEELRLIAERVNAGARPMPLLLLHDVGWPHGRRDDYFVPERIPAEHRQPIEAEGALHPDDSGIHPGALPYHHPAAREGGPGNGVLTAVEDFVAARDALHLAVVPTFFGLGVVWDRSSPYADGLERLMSDWDRNPHLERLEQNRVRLLADVQLQLTAVRDAERRLGELRARIAAQRELLERILPSRSFAVLERLVTLRRGRPPAFSRAAIRQVLQDTESCGPDR
jgi:hypothetical protein